MIVSAPCILDVEAAEPPGLASLGIRRGGVVTADGRLKNLPELQTVGGRTAVAQLRSDDSKLLSDDPTPVSAHRPAIKRQNRGEPIDVRLSDGNDNISINGTSSSLSDKLSYRTDLSLPARGGKPALTVHRSAALILQDPSPDELKPEPVTLPALAPDSAMLAVLHEDLERAAAYKKAARAAATHRAYGSDWIIYTDWCRTRGLVAMPAHPEQIAAFVANQAASGLKPSTIERRVAAIGHHHRTSNYPAPTAHPEAGGLREALAGIRNEKRAKKTRKEPADATALRDMLAQIKGDGLRARRDRAALAIGMAAALRRSELVALTLENVGILDHGIELYLGATKTDQAGEGATIAIPEGTRLRPKALLLEWISAVRVLEAGVVRTPAEEAAVPLFRRLTRSDQLTDEPMSDKAVARLVKRYAGAAGYDAAKFSGHSLRAGFLTEAASQGATIFKMQEVSRHKTVQVLSDYVRSADRFRDHAGERFL